MKIDRGLAALVLSAIGLAFLFHALHLPGAWLFAPLAVSAFFAVRGWYAVKLPQPLYIAGQAMIGTALGAGFSAKTLSVIPEHAGIFTFAVVFILLASLLNGWLLSRFTRLDPATSFLGTMPGGAGAMAAMSDSLGADTRLVTAIQYVRLLIILASLAIAAAFLKAHAQPVASLASAAPTAVLLQTTPFVAWKFAALLALAAIGWLAGMFTRIPAASFLVPTLLYALLGWQGVQLGGWPWLLLAVAYGIMGLQIGGRFHPSTIAMIRSVILPVIGTTSLLLVASAVLAFLVAYFMHLDLVSAYLAATPGGLDSVAAVATDLHVDTTIVVSMHLVRLLAVLLFGPWLVRLCASPKTNKPIAIFQ
jgi:membrane AbrB-like protein